MFDESPNCSLARFSNNEVERLQNACWAASFNDFVEKHPVGGISSHGARTIRPHSDNVLGTTEQIQVPTVIEVGSNPRLRRFSTESLTPQFLENSAFVGVLVVAITLVVAIPAAYSLARLMGHWGERAGILIFLVYLVPPTLLFIPLSRVVVALGLNNSVWSLVVVYPTITIPFSTWLLMGFFKSIPPDLEEQAMVDGYSHFMSFIKVVMPLSVSGVGHGREPPSRLSHSAPGLLCAGALQLLG